jgi:hypothetical protein
VLKYYFGRWNAMLEDVYANFTDLSKQDQIKLFNRLKTEFFSNEEDEIKDAYTSLEKFDLAKGLAVFIVEVLR